MHLPVRIHRYGCKQAYMEVVKTLTLITAALLTLTASAMSCTDDTPGQGTEQLPETDNDNGHNEQQMTERMIIRVNGTEYQASLEDNATAKAFAAMLPATLDMSELNGNEKYHYLENSLPATGDYTGTTHAGDIMLFGRNCIVLFYDTFNTSYSYTKIGHIDNPSGLAGTLGSGSVSVEFSTGG